MKTVTDETFDELVLGSDVPVLVDFWADWCPHCHALTPVLDQVAEEYAGRMTVLKIDVDANPQVTIALGVQAMPTLAFFRDGELVGRLIGGRPRSRLTKEINDTLFPTA